MSPRRRAPLGALLVALGLNFWVNAAFGEPAFGEPTTSHVKGEVDRAGESDGDGAYGRFDGDLDLGLGAGAGVDSKKGQWGLGARATAHYFSIAGVYTEYSDALRSGDETFRALGFGVDVRPLFIPRWGLGLQRGPALADLTLDSISLGLGAEFIERDGMDFGDERAFVASLGFGLPLLANASGPWLEARGALAFPDDTAMRAQALVILSWHELVLTGLVE
jgi:hypothetical protein